MKLVNHNNDTLEFGPPPAGGEHTAMVTVADDEVSASYMIRPDEALALGELLVSWAEDRMEKAGLF